MNFEATLNADHLKRQVWDSLRGDIAHNHMLLGLLEEACGPNPRWPELEGMVARDDSGAVLGCCLRTPPRPMLIFSGMPANVVPGMIAAWQAHGWPLRGAMGHEDVISPLMAHL